MQFDQIVQKYLKEARGVDPMKFGYRGGPMGFKKSTGIENPQKPTAIDRGPADEGIDITQTARRNLAMGIAITLTDPTAGAGLKKLIEQYGSLRFEYTNALKEVHATIKRLERLKETDSDLVATLKARLQEYKDIAIAAKTKMNTHEPQFLQTIDKLVKTGAQNFVKIVQSNAKTRIKSIDDLDKLMTKSETSEQALKLLKSIYQNPAQYKPLEEFVAVEKGEEKDPLFRFVTTYKTVLDTMLSKSLIGNPEKTLNYILGRATTNAIAEPTAGRTNLKQKDPAVVRIISLIKAKKFDHAKSSLNQTKLDEPTKGAISNLIDKLAAGKTTEAEVIRPLYNL